MEAGAEIESAAERAPCPRSTINFTFGPRTASCTAASIASGIDGTMVLSCSGRFSVMVATAPSAS